MTKTALMATTALLFASSAAWAGDEPQVAEAPVPTGAPRQAPLADAAQRGVLVFTPDFFAAQSPNTALEMVNRVPGFQIIDGEGTRGFEGSVGNVLINGSRPASKNDSGSNVLGRTLASNVGEVLAALGQLGQSGRLELGDGTTVGPRQLLGLELNPRAAAIADVVLRIGYLQWHLRTYGLTQLREPLLDRRLFMRGRLGHLHHPVDEQAQATLGREASSAGVRGRE